MTQWVRWAPIEDLFNSQHLHQVAHNCPQLYLQRIQCLCLLRALTLTHMHVRVCTQAHTIRIPFNLKKLP